MAYVYKKEKKRVSRAIIVIIVLAILYCSCGVAIVHVWLTHRRSIKETKEVLVETKNNTEIVVKDKIEEVSKTASKTVNEVTEKAKDILNLDEEAGLKAEAEAEAKAARTEKLTELKRRKDQLDLEIASADSRHRAATRTVPVTPAFDLSDSDSTRHASLEQRTMRERLRKEADEAGHELRKLKIERQRIIHEISRLEK